MKTLRCNLQSRCWQIAALMSVVVVVLLITVSPSYADIASAHEVHIIIDTRSVANTDSTDELTKKIDLNALRLISGALPINANTQLWAYQNKLESLAPIYTINKNRPKTTVPRISVNTGSTLIDNVSALVAELQKTPMQRDIILVTLSNDEEKQLDSSSVNTLATKLLETDSRFSVLQQADTYPSEVYKLLTTVSHGRLERLDKDARLESYFINILERFVSLDYIPLHETLMKIDTSINEATLILFKTRSQSNNIEIIPPLDQPFTNSNPPANVEWLETPNFDIINIANPSEGTWQVFTESHTDNRVIIDTTLKLTASTFDAQVQARSFQALNISLLENNQPVTDPDTMEYVAVKVSQIQDSIDQYAWFPADNGKNGDTKAKDGIFTVPLQETLTAADYTLLIDLDGKKFQRQLRRNILASDDLAWINQAYSPTDNSHTVTIIPFSNIVKPESIIINASVVNTDNTTQQIEIQQTNSYTWSSKLTSAKSIEINIAGTSPSGSITSIWLPRLELIQTTLQSELITPSHVEVITDNHTSPDIADVDLVDTQPHINNTDVTDKRITLAPTSTAMLILQLILINALLICTCFFGFKNWNQREKSWQQQLEGRLSYD